ncbi:MAG: serine hydrolase [candidate division Zixibacteria bacterium]|nr:serine hydrolase [candidate division Zixibacteria bacterium]
MVVRATDDGLCMSYFEGLYDISCMEGSMDRYFRLTGMLVVVVALTSGLASGQTSSSRTEKERAMEVLQAFQDGDLTQLLASMNTHWAPPEDPEERDARWRKALPSMIEEFGDGQVVSMMMEQPHVMKFVTERTDGPTLAYTFEFESDPPHRIVQMGVDTDAGGRGPGLPPLGLTDDASIDALDNAVGPWIDRLADNGMFSGAVLIAVDGQSVYSGAWGKASLAWDVDNQVDTRFDLGSINKSFTQIAIAQLAEAGKLSLDDHIIDLLPEYPNEDAARQITIRHLLKHTSGLGDIFTDEFFNSSRALFRQPRNFFPLFADEPLTRTPGEKREYSNAGYMVLGAIIAEVSGMPYGEYVTENIFKPAGMTGAGFFSHDEPVPNVAVGYTRMGPDGRSDALRSNLFMLPIKGNSAGSAQASVVDMLRFDNAVREYKLLSPASTMWYFGGDEPGPDAPTQDDLERSRAETGIAGGGPGVSAVMESNGRLTVIVLSNFDPPVAEKMGQELYRSLKRVVGGA